jgi:hypothetical protein
MLVWIAYLTFLFISVGVIYMLALNFFYQRFFGRKKRR